MPEPTEIDHDARQLEAGEKIHDFIQDYMDAHGGGAFIYELGMWMYTIIFRARQTFTQEEIMRWLLGLVTLAERAIDTAKEDGAVVITAEDWRNIEGGEDMLRELQQIREDTELVIPDWMLEEE